MNNPAYQVLLVEDNEDDYVIVRDLLADIVTLRFELTWVDTYEAAREALAQHHYDVCLVDYHLGEATGMELVHEYGTGETPFILLTGNEDYEIDVAAAKAGIADYLLKGHTNAPLLERSMRYSIERKKNETALLQAQRFAQATVDALPDSIAVLNEQGVIVAVNVAWCEFAASNGFIGADSGIGMNYLDVCLHSHTSEGRAAAEGIGAVIAQQKESFSLEYPCHSPQEKRWFQMCVTRFPSAGPLHVVIAHENITERKLAEATRFDREQEFETLVENAPDIISRYDRKFRHIYVNRVITQATGVPASAFIGKTHAELGMPPHLQAEWHAVLEDVFVSGQERETEFEFATPDGPRFYHSRLVPEHAPDGRIRSVLNIARDMSERKQAEDALRESEERFRAVFEQAAVGICIVGMDYRFERVNERFCEIVGYSADELSSGNCVDTTHLDDQAGDAAGVARLLAGEESVALEKRYIHKDGSMVWARLTLSLMRSVEGQPQQFIGVVSDITERKLAEALLTENQQRLALATESAHIGIWDWDIVANKLQWDAQMYALYGIREQDFGGAYEAWQNGLHTEDRAKGDADINAAIEGSRDFDTQFRVLWPSGEVRYIEAHASVQRASDGSPLRMIGVNWDITERKQAEWALRESEEHFRFLNNLAEAARTLADSEQIMVVMTRMLGRKLGASRCAYADVEEDGEAFMVLHDYTDGCASTMGNYHLSLFGARAVSTLSNGQTLIIRNVDDELAADEGADMFNAIGIKAIICCPLVKDGILRAMMSVHQTTPRDWQPRDISIVQDVVERCWATIERRKAEEKIHRLNAELEQRVVERTAQLETVNEELEDTNSALQKSKEEADQANAAKSEFLSRMSHELRTPLNAILGFGQILDRQELTPLQSESVGHILKGGRHLLGLINEVLDISRVETGSAELSIEPVQLDEVVAEACALVQPLAHQSQIRMESSLVESSLVENSLIKNSLIKNSVIPHTPFYVMADRQRLHQVLINLLSNAIKYNRSGGVVIISGQQVAGGRVQIRVQDSGWGLSAPELEKLFTPFERLHAVDNGIEGTGLGLVISQRLITAIGGTLGVESEVGVGSTFIIELPQAQVSAQDPGETLTEPENSPRASGLSSTGQETARTFTVLSIEDNLSNMRLMETILESRPEITLLGAMHGRIGLDIARQHHPDLILLDLHLPGLSGSEVLGHLQGDEATRDIPVIVVSADATTQQIERLLAAGATAYLTKPLDVENFLSTLDQILLKSG